MTNLLLLLPSWERQRLPPKGRITPKVRLSASSLPRKKESANRYDVASVAKDVACRMEKQRCLFMTVCLSMWKPLLAVPHYPQKTRRQIPTPGGIWPPAWLIRHEGAFHDGLGFAIPGPVGPKKPLVGSGTSRLRGKSPWLALLFVPMAGNLPEWRRIK